MASPLLTRLPRGGALPEDEWCYRHRGVTVLLWLHAVAIPVYAAVRGFPASHVVLESAIVPLSALAASQRVLSKRVRTMAASFGLLSCSAVLVHLSGGLIEMHFHFFVMVAVVSLYQDWLPFLAAIAYVLVHHGMLGALDPESVFNHPAAIDHPWRWAGIHALFIAGISAACLVNWRLNEIHVLEVDLAGRRLSEESRIVERLNEVGTMLAADLELDHVVQRVTDVATELTGASFGAFFYNTTNEVGQHNVLYALSGASKEAFDGFPLPGPTELLGPTHRGEGVICIDDVLEDPRYGLSLPHEGLPPGHLPVRSYLAVPVVSRGKVLGGLYFAHAQPARFGEAQVRVAAGIAAHAAVAVQNARLYANQRAAAETLQRSLLPDRLPTVPGLAFAARYLPGGPGVEVGGDWYDAFSLPDGTYGLVMGDVVGRGVSAASLMGQLRNALRAYAFEGHRPAEVLGRLNDLAYRLGLSYVATVVFAALNPASGRLCVANAGHLPPLLIRDDHSAEFVEGPWGIPLGVLSDTSYCEADVLVPPGASIALYTDGLIEGRSTPIDESLERLRKAAAGGPVDPEAMCAHIVERVPADGALIDDTALLIVRRLLVDDRPAPPEPEDGQSRRRTSGPQLTGT